MSAPAQVTEAHRVLARHLSTEAESVPHLCDLMAQAIADSEAQAVASALSNVTCTHHNDMARAECSVCLVAALRAERDQLRAGVERLRSETARIGKNGAEEYIRAERAEAELGKLRGFYNEIVAECGHDLIVREYRQRGELLRDEANRRKEAEAELAGIRALADRRNERDHSQDTTHQLVAALDQALDIAQAELAIERARLDWLMAGGVVLSGYYLSRLHYPVSRAAIDAAMKDPQ